MISALSISVSTAIAYLPWARALLAVLPGLARHGADREASRALFVDDSVRECCDERVASLPGLYRVCFRRGAVL